MTELIKKLSGFSLHWKLLLVPVVATLSFAAYLAYSSQEMASSRNFGILTIRYSMRLKKTSTPTRASWMR
jgi:hypothetical protein